MALSAVLAALSRRQAEADATFAPHSAVLQPAWQPPAEPSSDDAQLLQRATCTPASLDSLAQAEDVVYQQPDKGALVAALRQHFAGLKAPQKLAGVHSDDDFERDVLRRYGMDLGICSLVKDHSAGLSRRMVVAILRTSMRLQCLEPICGLVQSGQVSANECPELVDWLAEQAELGVLCICLARVPDLRPSHKRDILKLFLSSAKTVRKHKLECLKNAWRDYAGGFLRRVDGYTELESPGFEMHSGELDFLETPQEQQEKQQQQQQQQQASLKQETETPKSQKKERVRVGRRRKAKGDGGKQKQHQQNQERQENVEATRNQMAIKLAAAFDSFSACELCLHSFLCSGTDEAVLSSVFSSLDNEEVFRLLYYLNKWMIKYNTRSMSAATAEDRMLVPGLDVIVQWLAVILEDRFASFVLSKHLKAQLDITRQQLDLMLQECNIVYLEGITRHLLDQRPLPSATPGFGVSEHIIEYLQI